MCGPFREGVASISHRVTVVAAKARMYVRAGFLGATARATTAIIRAGSIGGMGEWGNGAENMGYYGSLAELNPENDVIS